MKLCEGREGRRYIVKTGSGALKAGDKIEVTARGAHGMTAKGGFIPLDQMAKSNATIELDAKAHLLKERAAHAEWLRQRKILRDEL